MENYLDTLNPQQYEAVTSTEGCIRVIAGAGSGKPGRSRTGSPISSMKSALCPATSSA